jgi:hypothetical protein
MPICRMLLSEPLKRIAEVRAMTPNRAGLSRLSRVIISSVKPSLKKSSSRPPAGLAKGSTASISRGSPERSGCSSSEVTGAMNR